MIDSRYARRYLREQPLFAAIVRPVECELITRAGIVEPCLDLGCGEGVFAGIACKQPLTIGIDPSAVSVRKAAQRKIHRGVIVGRGDSLPFADRSFATVLCNSVIEHIPPIEETIGEAYRVLRPGGRFLITTPSHLFADYLLIPRVLKSLGMRDAGAAYGRWFNRHSAHFHTNNIEWWRDRLTRTGFEITKAHYYLTRSAHEVFDLAHYASVPRWGLSAITGRWVLLDSSPLQGFWARILARLHTNALHTPEGPYLFVEAVKRR